LIELREETLVIVVAANPEPRDGITFKYTDGAVTKGYSHRSDVFLGIDTFEVQR
jgi:hypothetical protein